MDRSERMAALIEATERVQNVSAQVQERLLQRGGLHPSEHAQILADPSVALDAFRMAVRQAMDGPTRH
jgi:hypothetical protein